MRRLAKLLGKERATPEQKTARNRRKRRAKWCKLKLSVKERKEIDFHINNYLRRAREKAKENAE